MKELKNQIFEKVKRMDTTTLDDTINDKDILESEKDIRR